MVQKFLVTRKTQACWHIPVVPAVRGSRQEDHHDFKANPDYVTKTKMAGRRYKEFRQEISTFVFHALHSRA